MLSSAAADGIPLAALGQYGAAGVILMIFLWFGYKVYSSEKKRADDNEGEIKRLNQLIQDKYVPALQDAAHALTESTAALTLAREKASQRRT